MSNADELLRDIAPAHEMRSNRCAEETRCICDLGDRIAKTFTIRCGFHLMWRYYA